MLTGPRWARIIQYLLAAILTTWTWIYTWALGHADPKPWYVLALISFKISGPIIAASLIAVIEIWRDLKYRPSRVLLKSFLNYVHKKHFPHRDGGLSPNCRVTLFAPGTIRRKSLGVKARSGGFKMTSKVRWSIKRSEAEDYHGIAGYAWAQGIFISIDGLPDYSNCTPSQQQHYLRSTFITEKEVSKLHWKARSFRGLAVKNQAGDKVGVLMMESKQPDGLAAISAEALTGEAEYLQFLLA